MIQAQRTLKDAINGDIKAFQQLFLEFQPQLRSYLYRLLTDRNDAEDLAQDTFVKAFDKIDTFRGTASLKTWVFQIATNLAYDHLRKFRRWQPDAQDQAKALAMSDQAVSDAFRRVHRHSPYEVREHINFCFTCLGKTLSLEQQVAVILKDIYRFSRQDIAQILNKTEGVVKHLLFEGRRTMVEIFDHRCALINKNGACHQCTELAGIYNPKQTRQEELRKIAMVREAEHSDQRQLYALRATLVRQIDPLRSSGANFQEVLMQCTRQAIGEVEAMN